MNSTTPFILLYLFLVLIFYVCISVYIWSLNVDTNKMAVDEDDPWREFPSLELVVRTNGHPSHVRLYSTWLLLSLKLFWPKHLMNIKLLLDDESQRDYKIGLRLAKTWPYPKIAFRKPGDPSVYGHNQRRRMFLSYFYPDEYVSAKYVGFVDTDTMFITVITPQMLFVKGKPTVQARIGEPYYQVGVECWSDVTEYFLGEKEALQCMTYFPVIFKVRHVVEMRKFAEKRFGKPFLEIFRKSLDFQNPSLRGFDCICQYSIICNYVWYHHRDEYDFHLQMTPHGNWTGDHRRQSQQSMEYFKSIDSKYFTPKPRVAIHAQHYMENGVYIDKHKDITREPHFTHLKRRIQEGLCYSIWFDLCPKNCMGFEKGSLQSALYSFEMFDWSWDTRCLEEQKKHYKQVKELIMFNKKHGVKMFGVQKYNDICNKIFDDRAIQNFTML